jgi:hypothetical protein
MRRRFFLTVIGAPLALIGIGAGTALAVPRSRYVISGFLNMPDGMPALSANSQVHYQRGAEDFARDVAALLPDAIARVEGVHGRRFAHPVTVGVYATPEAYAAANGLGSTVPVGVTIFGRVNLSPKLFWPQHQRLRAILTHELSHAHIQGWIGGYAYLYLPNWFKEGLAVMLSGGGGAELVNEDDARAAIQRGERLVIDDAGSLTKLTDVRLEKTPANTPPWYPVVLAYREAGMFVNYLRDSDGSAFDRLMNAILDDRPFTEAVTIGYHDNVQSLWEKFTRSSQPQPNVGGKRCATGGAGAARWREFRTFSGRGVSGPCLERSPSRAESNHLNIIGQHGLRHLRHLLRRCRRAFFVSRPQ